MSLLTATNVVWLHGGPGRGKTHTLRAVYAAATLLATQPSGPAWLVLAVDAAQGTTPTGALSPQIGEALAELGQAIEPPCQVDLWPPADWLDWYDQANDPLPAEAVERTALAQYGMSLADVRRRYGREAAGRLVLEWAGRHGVPPPPTPLDRLFARATHQLPLPATCRLLLLVDNLDSAPPHVGAELLAACAPEHRAIASTDWKLVVASTEPPPEAYADRLTEVALPALAPAAIAGDLADRGLSDAVMTRDGWSLLARLVAGSPEPLTIGRRIVAEAAASSRQRPLVGDSLLSSASLCELLAEDLPANWAAHGRPDTGVHPTVDRYVKRLLLRAAAGMAAVAPPQVLEAEEPAVRLALQMHPALEIADGIRLHLAAPLEVALRQAVAEQAFVLPDRLVSAQRVRAIERLARSALTEVVWENVCYRGETIAADVFDARYGEPLPAEVAFRLVLLTQPQTVPASALLDERVVVLTPAPLTTTERVFWRSYAWHAAVADDAQALPALRQLAADWLARQEPAALHRAARAVAQGQATAQPALPDSWPETVSRVPPQHWAASLIRSRWQRSITARTRWVASDLLDEPLGDEQLAAVWDEVREGAADACPARHALGLAPQQEPAGFDDLRRMLLAGGGSVSLPDALVHLCAPPHGLTCDLARLFVLAFVVRSDPPSLLEVLEPGLGPGFAEAGAVRQWSWSAARSQQLLRLVRAGARPWSELLGFAQVVVGELAEGDGRSPDEQFELLRAGLRHLGADARQVSEALRDLAERFDEPLPTDAALALARFARVGECSEPAEFDRLLLNLGAAEQTSWASAIEAFRRWQRVAAQAPKLASLHDFVRGARLSPQHRLDGELAVLHAKLRLDRLLNSPNVIAGLLADGAALRRQYATVYAAAHRDHHARLAELHRRWHQLRATLVALARLDRLPQLGVPVAARLLRRADEIEPLLRPCRVIQPPPELPSCPSCGWKIGDPPTSRPLDDLQLDTTEASTQRGQKLHDLLGADPRHVAAGALADLLSALLGPQTTALPELLTDATVALLAAHLPPTPASLGVLTQLRERWTWVGPDDVEAAVADFESLLRAALAQARLDRPDDPLVSLD